MNLADVFTVVLVIVGLLTVFVGWWLAMAGLFPRVVERCAERLGAAPIKCFLVGLGCAVPLIAGVTILGKVSTNPAGKLFSVALVIALILAALAGAAGLALRIGRGLPASADGEEPWRRVRRGGIVLAITYGTIVLLPVTLLAGLGALVLARSAGADTTT
jgi:predicted permease